MLDIKKKSEKYIIISDKNKAELEINFLNNTYEIFRWYVKDEKFIEQIKSFDEIFFNNGSYDSSIRRSCTSRYQ